MMTPLTTYLKGLRGSRGFGIHSPFSFEFALNVLRQQCAFYDYPRLELLHSQTPRSPRRPSLKLLKLLYRVSARLDISNICLIGDINPLIVDALTMPSSNMTVNNPDAPRSLAVVAAKSSDFDDNLTTSLLSILAEGGSAVIFGHRALIIDRLKPLMTHGTIFTNGTNLTIIVGLKHLPVQFYTIRF